MVFGFDKIFARCSTPQQIIHTSNWIQGNGLCEAFIVLNSWLFVLNWLFKGKVQRCSQDAPLQCISFWAFASRLTCCNILYTFITLGFRIDVLHFWIGFLFFDSVISMMHFHLENEELGFDLFWILLKFIVPSRLSGVCTFVMFVTWLYSIRLDF